MDSRRFVVTGLRFCGNSPRSILLSHFMQFGAATCQVIGLAPRINEPVRGGFQSTEEPITRTSDAHGSTAGVYAIIYFLDETSAEKCANFGGKHLLPGGVEITVQRMSQLPTNSLYTQVPSNTIFVSFMGIRMVNSISLLNTFSSYGTITKIDFICDEDVDLECATVEFEDVNAVPYLLEFNHFIEGQQVKVLRVLRSEDVKKMAQKIREREHKEQWMHERASHVASTSQPHYDHSTRMAPPYPEYKYYQEAQRPTTYGYFALGSGRRQRTDLSALAGYGAPPPPPPPPEPVSVKLTMKKGPSTPPEPADSRETNRTTSNAHYGYGYSS